MADLGRNHNWNREEAQRRRHIDSKLKVKPEEPPPPPSLFGPPIKVPANSETKHIQEILGEHQAVRKVMGHGLLGVDRNPSTPGVNRTAQPFFPKPEVPPQTNNIEPDNTSKYVSKNDSKSKHNVQKPPVRRESSKSRESSSSSNSLSDRKRTGSRDKEMENKHRTQPNKTHASVKPPEKSSHESGHDKAHRDKHERSRSDSSSRSHSSASNKRDKGFSAHKSNEKGGHVSRVQHASNKCTPLTMPSQESKHKSSMEDILKETLDLPTPITAIQTPRKEEPGFPFAQPARPSQPKKAPSKSKVKRAESPPSHVSEDSSSSESEASDSESHSSAESDASDDEAPRQVTSRQPVTSTPPVVPPVSKSVKLDDDEDDDFSFNLGKLKKMMLKKSNGSNNMDISPSKETAPSLVQDTSVVSDEAPITPVSQQTPGPGGGDGSSYHDDPDGLDKCLDDIVNDRFRVAVSPLHCGGASSNTTSVAMEITTPTKPELLSPLTSPSMRPPGSQHHHHNVFGSDLYSDKKVFGLALSSSQPDDEGPLKEEEPEVEAQDSSELLSDPPPPLLSPNPKSSSSSKTTTKAARSSSKSGAASTPNNENIPEPNTNKKPAHATASKAKVKSKRSHSSSSSAKASSKAKDTSKAASTPNHVAAQMKSPAPTSKKDSKAKSTASARGGGGGRGGGRKSKNTTYQSKETIDTDDSNDSSSDDEQRTPKPVIAASPVKTAAPSPTKATKPPARKRSKKDSSTAQQQRRESGVAIATEDMDASNLSLKSLDLSHILDDVMVPGDLISPIPSVTNLPAFHRLSSSHGSAASSVGHSPRVVAAALDNAAKSTAPLLSPMNSPPQTAISPKRAFGLAAASPIKREIKSEYQMDTQPFPVATKEEKVVAKSRRKGGRSTSPGAKSKNFSVLSNSDNKAVRYVDGVPSIVVSINLSLLDMVDQGSLRTHIQDSGIKVEKHGKNVFEDFGRQLGGTHPSPVITPSSSQPPTTTTTDCVLNTNNADQSDSKPAQHLSGSAAPDVKRENLPPPDYSLITGVERSQPPTSLKIPKKTRPTPRGPGSSERSCDGSEWPPSSGAGYEYGGSSSSMKRRPGRPGGEHSSHKRFRPSNEDDADGASPGPTSSPWNQRGSDYDPAGPPPKGDARWAQSPYATSPYMPSSEYGRHGDDFSDRESIAGRGDDAPPHWSTEERHHRDRPSHKYPADDHRDKWREGPPRGYPRGDRVAAGRGRSRDRYERAPPPPPPPRRRDSGERESYDHREGDRRGWEHHHRRGAGEYERESVERKRPRNYSRDWDAPNEEPLDASDYDPPPAISPYHGGSTDSKGGAKVASQWGALAAGGHPTPSEAPSSSSRDARDERGYREGERGGYDDERGYGVGRGGGYPREPARPRVVPLIDKFEDGDSYLRDAKRQKHQADRTGDKVSKLLLYIDAVLSFLMCGLQMERSSKTTKIFKMYSTTLELVKHISQGSGNENSDCQDRIKKLAVFSLRIQSLLCLRLYRLKKAETARLKSIIDEHNKQASKSSNGVLTGNVVQAPSPYSSQGAAAGNSAQPTGSGQGASWGKGASGTPSPMSPQPSPAGSVGSVGSAGSQGDGTTKPTAAAGNVSSTTVCVPTRIHSMTAEYLKHMHYLYQSHDLWDQADTMIDDKEFFLRLDRDCGALSFQSSVPEIVRYFKEGSLRLKSS